MSGRLSSSQTIVTPRLKSRVRFALQASPAENATQGNGHLDVPVAQQFEQNMIWPGDITSRLTSNRKSNAALKSDMSGLCLADAAAKLNKSALQTARPK